MKSRITTANLLLTGLNTGDSFTLEKAGRTSFQPIGTVTGIVKLQFSNDKTNFFDLLTGLDVSQPFVIETTDYLFYRFIVTTIGTGTVKWSVSNSDTVQDSVTISGSSGGVTSFNTRTGDVTANTNDYNASQIENAPAGDITATNVQVAINQLDSKIDENTGLITGQKAFLTSTQANTTVTPVVLTSHTFTLPPLKSMDIKSIVIFTAGATTTGLIHGIRVANPIGATANVIGSAYNSVDLASTQTATSLQDGDAFNVAPNTNSLVSITGTATTAGNNASILWANIYNQSTNTDAIITIEFASEVNASAVTAQIGTGATALIF